MMKKILKTLIIAVSMVLMLIPLGVRGGSDEYVREDLGVMSSEEVSALQAKAQRISDKYEFGVYVHIIPDESGQSYDYMDDYIESYYASNDLGYGSTHDGILLLITQSAQGGSYQCYIPGNSNQAYWTLEGLDRLDEAYEGHLYNHDYYAAADAYLDEVEWQLNFYFEQGGLAWSTDTDPELRAQREATSRGVKTVSTFGIPPIAGLLTVLGMKSKNKTKHTSTDAERYVVHDSMRLTNSRDIFMYRSTSRTPIPEESHSSSGGSHYSSSGGMHSGGGHF